MRPLPTFKMRSSLFLLSFLLLFPVLVGLAEPPDAPLRPQEWIQKMGNGNWMIFNIEPDDFTFADVSYDPAIPDSLLSIGQTGGRVWIDHWEPDYWKNGAWTAEQNLAYTDYLLDTLRTLGIAGAGPQTRRLWDNENKRFFRDEFTQAFIGVLKEHDWRVPTAVEESKASSPMDFELEPNYPNPFNPATTISFALASAREVRLEIYDLHGRPVRLLLDGFLSAGRHKISWDGTNGYNRPAAGGVYFARLQTGVSAASIKLMLLR